MVHHFFKLILIFFLFVQGNFIFAQNSATYNELISSADAYFAKKDYYNAKATYQLALERETNADYPKKKIADIIQILNKELEVRLVYEEKIQNAELAYANKDYQKAISLYREAGQIINYEEKPKQEIARIEEEWNNLKTKQSNFDRLLSETKIAKQNQDFSSAISKLEEADKLFPSKSEVLSEIAQLKLLLKQQNAKLEEFNRLVTEADRRMEQDRFQDALNYYQQAAVLFENNIHVKNQLVLVKEAIKTEDAYNKTIESADNHYIALELNEAKKAYEEAKKIWPQKTYPGNMLAKLDEARQRRDIDLKRLNDEYNAKIVSADREFNNQKYEPAYDLYLKALNLKPEEAYPQNQIQKINKLLAAGYLDIKCEIQENGQALTEAYIELIDNGISQEIAVSANGIHKIKLKLNNNYQLKFKKDGYIQKIYSIDSHLPTDEDLNKVFTSTLTVELFPICSIDLSLFDKPLASINYKSTTKEFSLNLSGFEVVIRSVDKLKNECAQKLAEEKKLKDYEDFLAQASALQKAEDYSLAINFFQKASDLFPEKTFPKEQILALNALLKQNNDYKQLIINGDNKFAQGKLNDALFDYYKAKNLKPKATYPPERIAEIDAILAFQNEEEKTYLSQLQKADSLFDVKLWLEAIAQYEKVIILKKTEPYPKNRLEQAKKFLSAQKDLDASYQTAIKKADAFFEILSYAEAKSAYIEANRIKPNEPYPLYKIEDINTIVEQKNIRETNNRYRELVASADKYFAEKTYHISLTQYKQASALKPNEVYPPQQIAKINELLAAQSDLENEYNSLIKTADSAFYLEKLNFARGIYVQSKELKPLEEYPVLQISKIDDLLSKMNNLEQNYQNAIAKADAEFSKNQYVIAKADYILALTYKPTEAYPKQKIAEIDAILAQMDAIETAYQKAILEGDQNCASKKYLMALSNFKEAAKIKETEPYPKSRISAIELILAEIERIKLAYNQAVAKADELFGDKQFSNALPFYKEAQGLMPEEKYPPEQINRINTFLNLQLTLDEDYRKAVAEADKLFGEKFYSEAISPYQKANQLKPVEKYPIDQIAKIRELLGASEREYQAFIKQGDDAYRIAIFQDAILAYENALGIFPNKPYPRMMLDKIDAKIRRESIVSLVEISETIANGKEKLYSFKPIDYRDRQNNYILIEMKNAADVRMRVFINFGKDGTKNGGYSVNMVQREGFTKYFVRIDRHLRWKSEDNNWISLLPEGGDLELNKMQISSEEKNN